MFLYETSNWGEETTCEEEREFHEEILLKKIVNCGNKLYVNSLGNSLHKVRDKFERYIKRMVRFLYITITWIM
jgi:hypothetical protein